MSRVRKVTGMSPAAAIDRLVEGLLLARRGHPLGDHELQLGAEQADADGAGLRQMRQVDEEPGIELQVDLGTPSRGDGRHVAQLAVLLLRRARRRAFSA